MEEQHGMRRLTLEEVREAYAKTGYTPVRGKTRSDEDKKACAIGVLGLASGLKESSVYIIAHMLGLSEEYQVGFVCGFDNNKCDTCPKNETRKLGVQDGRAIAEGVFGATSNA